MYKVNPIRNMCPDPFDGSPAIEISLRQEAEGSIDIFNLLGNNVGSLATATFKEDLLSKFTWKSFPAWPLGICVTKVFTGSESKRFRVPLIS